MTIFCSIWQKAGWAASLGLLFKGVGQLDERWLAVGAAHEGEANGQIVYEAGRNGDERVASAGGGAGAAGNVGVAVDKINGPGGDAGRGDEGIQLVVVENGINALAGGAALALVEHGEVVGVGQVGFGLGHF